MYTLLTTGDVPGAATYFNPLLKQTIIQCTSGTRPASPAEGTTIYETDTTRFLTWNTVSWRTVMQNGVTNFTPALTGATANPVLGTGSNVAGRYVLHDGNVCTYWGNIQFGTSGVSAGTGQYFVSLPVAAAASTVGPTVGAAVLRDISGAVIQSGSAYLFSSATTLSLVFGGNVVTSTSPWTWSTQDYIAWSLTYEV